MWIFLISCYLIVPQLGIFKLGKLLLSFSFALLLLLQEGREDIYFVNFPTSKILEEENKADSIYLPLSQF